MVRNMGVLIGMAVYSTAENKKDECLERTLESLRNTVNFEVHKLMLSVNAKTEKTENIIERYTNLGVIDHVIYNPENLGTAGAINHVIRKRSRGQHIIKLDDDIVIHQSGWIEEMLECIERDPKIGIVGLKRKDLIQSPWHEDPAYRSKLTLLPHEPGQRWIQIEESYDIIGTCTMFNSALLDIVGYSFQPGKYGFEDNLMCHRSRIAGFYNCFLNHINLDHIDPSAPEYQKWKESHSGELFPEYYKLVHAMIKGEKPIYYNPYE